MKNIYFTIILCLSGIMAMSQYVQGTIVQNPIYANTVDIYGLSTTGYNYPIREFNFVVSIPSSVSKGVTATLVYNAFPTTGAISSTVSTVNSRTYYSFQYLFNFSAPNPAVEFVANTSLLLASVKFSGGSGSTAVRLTDENSKARGSVQYWYIQIVGTAGQNSGEISADYSAGGGQQEYYGVSNQNTVASVPSNSAFQYVETNNAILLPITLASFTATKAVDKINIAWATASEQNSASFMVQRSSNGVDFAPVTSVVAVGAGANKYAAIDASPLNGTSFYRLKNIDKDNSFTYSNIISVNFNASGNVSVYPSPATDFINVNVSNTFLYGTVSKLIDFGGRTIKSFAVIGNTQQVDISNLATGMYFIKLADGTNVKFIKK